MGFFDELKDRLTGEDHHKKEAAAAEQAPDVDPSVDPTLPSDIQEAEASRRAESSANPQDETSSANPQDETSSADQAAEEDSELRAQQEEQAAQEAQAQADADAEAARQAQAQADAQAEADRQAQAAQEAAAQQAAQQRTYTVQEGDNLSWIGEQFGVDYMSIAQANGIENPDLIYPGQVLRIP